MSNAIALLKSLAGTDLSLELPTLGETLGSIRNFKLARENDNPPATSRSKFGAGGAATHSNPANPPKPAPVATGEAAR